MEQTSAYQIIQGDALKELRKLPDEHVQSVITSPPYWGQRNYNMDGQLGLEGTPEEHVENMVEIFHEVRRVLRNDGTLWLNYGDTYYGSQGEGSDADGRVARGVKKIVYYNRGKRHPVLKPKDLCGVPWRVAFSLQRDGWWLRSDIIWHKLNPKPGSAMDRPSSSHEYIFLLTKSRHYFYDANAVRREWVQRPADIRRAKANHPGYAGKHKDGKQGAGIKGQPVGDPSAGAHLRDVWTFATGHYSGAHFATFPPRLVELCVKAGSKEGDMIFDPFTGSGTVGLVALKLGRRFIGIELNPDYVTMAEKRLKNTMPLFQGGKI